LAFCCLSSAFGAKITKKVEKTSEKPEAEAAATPIEEENDDDDEDDNDDEEEEEQEAVDPADKEPASSSINNNKQRKPCLRCIIARDNPLDFMVLCVRYVIKS